MFKIKYPLKNKQAQLFITESCNLRCKGCPYASMDTKTKEELKKKEIAPQKWKIITDYLYKKGCRFFCIIGGEPASYEGVEKVIENITSYPNALVLLSTSGIHMLKDERLRKKIVNALIKPKGRKFKNGIAISFDKIPSLNPSDSREFKAKAGLQAARKIKKEYGEKILYIGNVMVTPQNLKEILKIQKYLEKEGIFTNLCTIQNFCFGKENPFRRNHIPILSKIAREFIRRKLNGSLIVNSVNYLSELPNVLAFEKYKCWEEEEHSPVIDIGPYGKFRYCNWITQQSTNRRLEIASEMIIEGKISWKNFWNLSRQTTKKLCKGCSWSRRDRNLPPMVEFNRKIFKKGDFPSLNPLDLKYQNIWVQAQLLSSEEKN